MHNNYMNARRKQLVVGLTHECLLRTTENAVKTSREQIDELVLGFDTGKSENIVRSFPKTIVRCSFYIVHLISYNPITKLESMSFNSQEHGIFFVRL